MKRQDLFKIIIIFLIWRIGLLVVGTLAQSIIKYEPSFPYAYTVLNTYHLPQWLYSWSGFDGVHYLKIAENGYVGTALIQAFFPLYPFSIRFVNIITSNTIISGLVISNLLFLSLLITWWSLIKRTYNSKIAWLSLVILVSFPTSLFFGAVYSESLFLFLAIAAFLAADHQKWWLVSLLAMLATATRLVGIFLVPALLIELADQKHFFTHLLKKKSTKAFSFISKYILQILLILTGSLGLLSYMFFLNSEFKDPFYFFHVQEEFGGGRSESIVLYPQVVWRAFKILLTARPINLKYLAYAQEFLFGTGTLVLLLAYIKKIKASHLFFALAALILPTLTGTFSSMPRYVLVCFPVYIILAKLIENSKVRQVAYFLVSILLLVVNTILFIQGYWVA